MRLQIDEAQKEIKNHGSYEFPFRLSHERLSWFDTGSFPWHWHPEIELTLVLEGEIFYQVNENQYVLKEGEGLFCNSNALHAGRRTGGQDCHYLSVTFHPRLLYGYPSSLMQSEYVNPILKDASLTSLALTQQQDWMRRILNELHAMMERCASPSQSLEIQLQLGLLRIWAELYEHVEHDGAPAAPGRDTERIRLLLSYIQKNYSEELTLEELAGQVHLCKSEACRMFKRYMNETIFDYLLNYRVERSLELLRDGSLNITQVAQQVGFPTPGYYARIFRRRMNCTPMQYKTRQEESRRRS